MVEQTIVGSPGTHVEFKTSNNATYKAVTGIFNAAVSGTYDTSAGIVTGSFIAADPNSGAIYRGSGTKVVGVLTEQSDTEGLTKSVSPVYNSYTAVTSKIYAGDDTNSTIDNNNPYGTLTGFFGSGSGTGIGAGETNTFSTDAGSKGNFTFTEPTDLAYVQANTLNSSGQDTVSFTTALEADGVVAHQTNDVTVSGAGADSVTLGIYSTVLFYNTSTGLTTISASYDGVAEVSGSGSTSVTGSRFADFVHIGAVGNVTLVGGAPTAGYLDNNGFIFESEPLTKSTATDMVRNFDTSDGIVLRGYGTGPAAYGGNPNAEVRNGTATLHLSDGTNIKFTNIAAGITNLSSYIYTTDAGENIKTGIAHGITNLMSHITNN